MDNNEKEKTSFHHRRHSETYNVQQHTLIPSTQSPSRLISLHNRASNEHPEHSGETLCVEIESTQSSTNQTQQNINTNTSEQCTQLSSSSSSPTLFSYLSSLLANQRGRTNFRNRFTNHTKHTNTQLPILSKTPIESVSGWRRWRTSLCLVGVGLFLFAYISYHLIVYSEHIYLPVKSSWRTLDVISDDTDNQWIGVLKNERISYAKRFAPAGAASHKFQVYFVGGEIAMAKPLSCMKLVFRFGARRFHPNEHGHVSMVDDFLCQGWGDVIGYHLDRLFLFYRKPPAVGRRITNKQLYSGASLSTDWEDTLNWFLWWLPSYNIDVVLQPWLRSFNSGSFQWARVQNKRFNNILANQEMPVHFHSIPKFSPYQMYLLLDVSDTLVYDYLMDDHDRKAEKNWVFLEDEEATKEKKNHISLTPSCTRLERMSSGWPFPCPSTLLLWDTGLGFQHGPYSISPWTSDEVTPYLEEGGKVQAYSEDTHQDCRTILRGSNYWRRMGGHHVCKFRKHTYQQVKALAASSLPQDVYKRDMIAPQPTHSESMEEVPMRSEQREPTILEKLAQLVDDEILAPIFRFAVYELDVSRNSAWYERIQFSRDAFLDGFRTKATMLLQHIDHCIEQYSEQEVLLDDFDFAKRYCDQIPMDYDHQSKIYLQHAAFCRKFKQRGLSSKVKRKRKQY